MDKNADRLTALEEGLAHLTRATDDLSEIVARQDLLIARLTRRLDLLLEAEAQRQADAGGTIPLADQRPPHY
ncbi:SlyX family protein [Paracoccus bogoriensis]|uniref:SlyX family protein n=1 Tax=Paracoccus bogoriensis TaxID=242065 RepID=UPI001C67D392|nr:SlyX family protein [Paracoccus bogoriensis]MBW7055886.1 SlyX family protein [Paracoccus bogoriensis]